MNNPTLQHLTLLGYESGDRICYRGFLPEKGGDKGRKAEATFPTIPSDLKRWEAEGRGVYVVVNPGGQLDKEITQGVAIFYEHDQLSKDISHELWQRLGLPEPTFQVDTGSKSIHSYWVFSEPISVEQWKPLQADLLEFADGDRSIKNPSRVMRLAGIKHPKTGERAAIITQSGQRYDYATLRAVIPSPAPTRSLQPQGDSSRAITWAEFERSFQFPCSESIPLEICLSKASREALERGAGEGGRNDTGAKLARDLLGASGYLESLGQRYEGDPRDLFDAYCDRCSPPLPQGERVSIWGSAEKSNPGPSLSPEKIENCAKAWVWKNQVKSEGNSIEEQNTPVTDSEAESRPRLAHRYRAVQQVMGARLALNELTKQIELDGKVVEDVDQLRLTLALEHNIAVYQGDFDLIIKRLAKANAYHPVQRYLEKCSVTHGDDTAILQGMAERYFGAVEPIYQIYLKRALVGAVARVFDPGCKLDTALILQGPQGYGKSTFFSTLAGPDWFDDSMGAATSERDERLKLHQFWFLEWSELSILRKRDITSTKSFLSSRMDTVRPPYGRQLVTYKRCSIIVGSTNEDDFLTDSTGNRRFWVVPVRKRIDTTTLATERDRIWAAAVSLYRSNFQPWLTHEEEAIASELNQSWEEEDPWAPVIQNYLLDTEKTEVTSDELFERLDIDIGARQVRDQMRVAKVLKSLGWTKSRKRLNGARRYVWSKLKPENVPTSEQGASTPEDLNSERFKESPQPSVPSLASLTSMGRVSLEPLQGSGSEDRPNRPNHFSQKTKNFLNTNGYGNGYRSRSLDVSEEKLTQVFGADGHGS